MRHDPFAVLSRFAMRRRRGVIAAWIVLVLVAGALGSGLHSRLGTGGFEVPGSDSLAVQQSLERDFPGRASEPAFVVVHHDVLRADAPGFAGVLERLRERVAAVPGVDSVSPPGDSAVSRDRHTALLGVVLRGDQSAQVSTAARVIAALDERPVAGYAVEAGGRAALYSEANRISKADLQQAELVSFPVTAIVLVLTFGGIVAAGLPLVLGMASLAVTLGALFLLSSVTTLSIYVTNSASIIGIGVGIDYALFLVTRYREERAGGADVEPAITAAMVTAGRAVALSGATVVVALAGLFLMPMQAFRSMGLGCVTVVLLAVCASLTLLPALLRVLGDRVDRLAVRLPRLGRGPSWHAWAVLVMRRPKRFLAATALVLGILSVPLAALHLGQPSARTLPADSGARVAFERVAAEFAPGMTGPAEIVVDTRAASLARLTSLLRDDPGVAAVTAGAPSRDGTRTRVTVVGRDIPQSDAGQALIRRIRDEIVPAAGLAGAARTGGPGAADLDLTDGIRARLPYVVATVLALSFLVLAAALRSLVLPLKAVAMNLLSVCAAYGIVVAVFQWGWGAGVLGFTPEGQIQAFVPLFLFCILFGLSMDYEVLMLSRVREEFLRTGDADAAVAVGLERTGRTVTCASLVMVTVFAAFAGSRLLAFKAEGLGLAVAIAIDATLIRVIAVPAAMKLLGRRNWWMPAPLGRLLPVLERPRTDP